jgi:DNA-binding XRE family transcriptional regulator
MSRDGKSEPGMQKKSTTFARLHRPKRARSVTETPESRAKRLQGQRDLGARIRRLRLKAGLAQDAFAEICEIHRSHLGEIERGESNLTLQTIITLAHGLNLTVHELLKDVL